MTRTVSKWTRLTEPCETGVHQSGVQTETVVWAQTQFLHDPWSVRIDEDICTGAQISDHLEPSLAAQADCNGTFVSMAMKGT